MAIFDYTGLNLDELINKIGNTRFFNLPKMLEEALNRLKSLISANERSYKVYTALLTQTGTNAPVATVLENTLGEVPVWIYEGVGAYSVQLGGDKIVLIPNDFTQDYNIVGISNSGTQIVVFTIKAVTYLSQDEILSNTPIEIRVYN